MGISIVSAIGLGLFIALIGFIVACGTMGHYRVTYYYGRQDGEWKDCGSFDCPWCWLAIRKMNKLIESDSEIGEAVIEDISAGYWNDEFCVGRVVWEWKK